MDTTIWAGAKAMLVNGGAPELPRIIDIGIVNIDRAIAPPNATTKIMNATAKWRPKSRRIASRLRNGTGCAFGVNKHFGIAGLDEGVNGNEENEKEGHDDEDVKNQGPVAHDDGSHCGCRIFGILQVESGETGSNGNRNDRRDDRSDDDQHEEEVFGNADRDQRPVGQHVVEAAAKDVSGAAQRSSGSRGHRRA